MTTALVPSEEKLTVVQTDAQTLYDAAVQRVELIESDAIATDEVAASTAMFMRELKVSAKDIEEQRRSWTDPLLKQKKRLDSMFTPMRDRIKALAGRVSVVLGTYQAKKDAEAAAERREQARLEAEAEQKRRVAEAAKAAAAAQTGRDAILARIEAQRATESAEVVEQQAAAVVTPGKKAHSYTKGAATSRKTWAFEITDEAKVPRSFLTVDTVAIGYAVRQGERIIPGVRIYQKTTVV